MAPRWAKLGPRWLQVGQLSAKMWPDGARALLGGSWRCFWDLGGDLAKTNENAKNEASSSLVEGLGWSWGALGGYVGSGAMLGYVGLRWAILAPSSAILADLGLKLRPSWQDVSTKMPKMS